MMKPNVVKELTLGATKVKICDNACRDRSEEEVKEILNRISRFASSVMKEGGKATA